MDLLSRDEFREEIFQRDHYTCVLCDKSAIDAHHILERRLFSDGGYYLENGASLCSDHHLQCEMTTISVEELRIACGITKIIIPPHLYDDQIYDKWGNPILHNGRRLIGELFYDESVQKILQKGDVLCLFDKYVKYPRTYHLPWSPGVTKDDRVISNLSIFDDMEVVVTLKMDGENSTLYNDYLHARSIDGRNHVSRNWLKNFHSEFSFNIPSGWRVCGENVWAKHSIKYDNLRSYFYCFSIWDDKNRCLSWDDTIEWISLLDLISVEVIYRGIFDRDLIEEAFEPYKFSNEGYVVRNAHSFSYFDFRNNVGKWVRKNHVSERRHWFFGANVERNELC